jgi:hypothetical protein
MRALLVFLAALLAAIDVSAATTVLEEGVSTGVTRRGNLNKVSKAFTTDQVYYWIRYEGTDGKKSTMQCVVTDPRGVPIDDSKDVFEEEAGGDNWTLCGVDGDEMDLQAGTYKFEITLNGEKIGERTVPVEARSFFGQLTARKKYKYALGVLALIIIVGGWLMKRMRGKKSGDALAASVGSTRGVKIGANVADVGTAATATPPKTPPPPTPADLAANFKAKLAADPNFKVAKAEEVLPIAKAARAAGDSKTAIAAVRGFDKAFPGHALIPDVFLFSAKLLAEDFKNADMARKILEHVIAKYPGHHLAQEARTYLKGMPAPA